MTKKKRKKRKKNIEFLTGQKKIATFFLSITEIQNVRRHLQTKPGVKSEWLNGLDSVLIQKIEKKRRVQPRITHYLKQGQSSQQSFVTTIQITIQMTVKYTSL